MTSSDQIETFSRNFNYDSWNSPGIYGIEGIEGRLHLLFQVQHFIELFESISVQLSLTISKPYRSLLRRDISLGLGHKFVSTPAYQF